MDGFTNRLPAAPLLETASGLSPRQRLTLAWRDMLGGTRLWRLAATLAWLDIKLKYRGSVLGPFWLTLSTGVMVGAMGTLYGTLFHMDLTHYLPFLALSLVLWNALGGLVADACTTFLQAEQTIRSLRMPFFVFALRVVIRTVISLLHNLPVIAVVFVIFHAWPGATMLLCLPGLALWIVLAIAACLMLGPFCARFRDVPPIVGSVMQIAFFITPIVWQPQQLGAHGGWLLFNPFYSILEIVRAPLLGHVPAAGSWPVALGCTVVFCAAAWLLFARVRARLAFWI